MIATGAYTYKETKSIHEQYHEQMRRGMEAFKDDKNVDGLLLKYRHFFGSYDYVGASANWYKHEIRIIKNNKSIYSFQDAQGFRKGDNEKLVVHPIDASCAPLWMGKGAKSHAKKNKRASINFGAF